jgi:hypothetical protein
MKSTRPIDSKAQKIFKNHLPDGWIPREKHPDIHIDYEVEIGDSNAEPTGEVFWVQLKGTQKPRYRGHIAKQSFKTKHLLYYLTKVKLPVFIVLVDVKSGKAFWLLAQEWLKSKNIDLGSRKTIDVEVPLSNDLSDTEKLLKAVKSAEAYMRELWPSSVEAAVNHKKIYYEQLDNRFVAEISHMDGKTISNFHAISEIPISISIEPSRSRSQRISDLIESGKPAIFKGSEVLSLKGSPLFDLFLETGNLSQMVIQSTKQAIGTLIVSIRGATGQEKTVFHGIEGAISFGKNKGHFKAVLKKTPFYMELSFPFAVPNNNRFSVNIGFNSIEWEKISILSLPYFDKLKEFFSSVNAGCGIKIVCEVDGAHIFTASTDQSIGKGLMGVTVEHFHLLDKLRTIAAELGQNFLYPKGGFVDSHDFEDIGLLHTLITGGKQRIPGNGVRFRGKLNPNECFYEMIKKPPTDCVVSFLLEVRLFKMLDTEIPFGPISYSLTFPKFVNDSKGLVEGLSAENVDPFDFEVVGCEKSEMIIAKGQ